MVRMGTTVAGQGGQEEAGGAPRASAPQAALGERAAPSLRGTNEESGPVGARARPPVGNAGAGAPVAPAASGGPGAPPLRWSANKKRDVVLRLLRGEPVDALSRELSVESYRLEEWRKRALAGIEGALRERESDRGQGELGAAMKRIGELSMEVELLRARNLGPLVYRRSRP